MDDLGGNAASVPDEQSNTEQNNLDQPENVQEDEQQNGTENEKTHEQTNGVQSKTKLRRLEKIPLKFYDMQGIANSYIMDPYIEEEYLLPERDITIIHFNAHIDEIVPEDMQYRLLFQLPNARNYLYKDFGIESWIYSNAQKGRLNRVVWFKPPWTLGVPEGHRDLLVPGEKSGEQRKVSLDIKTVGRSVFEDVEEDYDGIKSLFDQYLSPGDYYMLAFELSFFTCESSFASNFEKCPDLYSKFTDLFKIEFSPNMSAEDIQASRQEREKHIKETEEIFMYVAENKAMPPVEGEPTEIYKKISELREAMLEHYTDEEIDWKYLFDAGLVCNDYELPVHYTERIDIEEMVNVCLSKIMDLLPIPPAVIGCAVMLDYLNYVPKDNIDFTIDLLSNMLKAKFENLDCRDFIGYG